MDDLWDLRMINVDMMVIKQSYHMDKIWMDLTMTKNVVTSLEWWDMDLSKRVSIPIWH
jgi:hypothetical protein